MARFPFFESEPYERRMMFQRSPDMGVTPLTILPTARLAANGRLAIQRAS
jgi:hypothetical protein